MNIEASHVAQWEELTGRAQNFRLAVSFDATAFYLWGPLPSLYPRTTRLWVDNDPAYQRKQLGQYLTLADLRAGISDYIAGERAAGRIKT